MDSPVSSPLLNREGWLALLISRLVPLFDERGASLPEKIQVSVSFPSKGGLGKRRVTGQCWYPQDNADEETTTILVSPLLYQSLEVAETVLHELIHASVGAGHGHKGPFIDLARRMGFTKPWTSTPATGELKGDLQAILDTLPPYPHTALEAKESAKGKPQTTRLVKVECVKCSYTLRTTRMWIEKGLPTCYCGGEIQETEKES